MSCNFQRDQIWQNSSLWQNLGSLWKSIDGLFKTIGYLFCYWANFHFFKRPNIEQIDLLSGHTGYIFVTIDGMICWPAADDESVAELDRFFQYRPTPVHFSVYFRLFKIRF